jgi:hypothetical protein
MPIGRDQNPDDMEHRCGRAGRNGLWVRRLALALVVAIVTGCGSGPMSEIDSTPTKLDGAESHEFEPEDVEAASEASDAVKEYCAGAVSEAQRLGCESHVTEEDLP